jgi:hypothetical protein
MANDVLVVQTGLTYTTLALADSAAAGVDHGVPTQFEIDGTLASSDANFSNADYLSSIEIYAKAGQETTGDIAVGAKQTGRKYYTTWYLVVLYATYVVMW